MTLYVSLWEYKLISHFITFVTGQLENVKRQLPGAFEKLPNIVFRCRICVFLDVEIWLPLHSFSSNVDLNYIYRQSISWKTLYNIFFITKKSKIFPISLLLDADKVFKLHQKEKFKKHNISNNLIPSNSKNKNASLLINLNFTCFYVFCSTPMHFVMIVAFF